MPKSFTMYLIQDDGTMLKQPETELSAIIRRAQAIHESAGLMGGMGVLTIEIEPKKPRLLGYVHPAPTKKEVMDALAIVPYSHIKATVEKALAGKIPFPESSSKIKIRV